MELMEQVVDSPKSWCLQSDIAHMGYNYTVKIHYIFCYCLSTFNFLSYLNVLDYTYIG